MPFQTGPNIRPFESFSQDAIELLESITPIQKASAVPRIVITKIDFRTGRPDTSVRPMMFDLTQTPQFGALDSQDTFAERASVSLMSLEVISELLYGPTVLKHVNLKFVVHRPDIVFVKDSPIAWRQILEENNSFSLQYGWTADPTVCDNPLMNGQGYTADNGYTVKSEETVLLIVARWNVHLRPTGEVDVNIEAYENGDIALRESRFADAAEAVVGRQSSDDNAAKSLFNLLQSVPMVKVIGRGNMVRLGDVMDTVMAPMIAAVTRAYGYVGVNLFLANFNESAGSQSQAWGGRYMGGVTSLADFLIPVSALKELMTEHLASGRAMLLINFFNTVITTMNRPEAWAASNTALRPHIGARWETTQDASGASTLSGVVFDRNSLDDAVKRLTALPAEQQSKDAVMQKLRGANVPVIEFGRAGSMVLDAAFEMQPHPLIQSIQIETAERSRKDRGQTAATPDVESRKGQAAPHDIVPASILEGDLTLVGNFVFDAFRRLWIEFYGASSISGIFNVMTKTDRIEAGVFTSALHLVSDGADPLGTRQRPGFDPTAKP